MIRKLSLELQREPDTQLPLTTEAECIKVNDLLDLSQSLLPNMHQFIFISIFSDYAF